jgi:ketosteroid isomerase-like protein
MFIDFKLNYMHVKVASLSNVVFFVTLLALPQKAAAQDSVEGLIQVERDFAAFCGENGLPEAWVKFFAPDGLVFQPHPKNAQEVNSAKIPSPKPAASTLYWEPYHGATSIGGDLGFNTGPWRIASNNSNGQPPQYGYFFSVWKKQPSGDWKVLLDLGSTAPAAGPEHVFGAEYDVRKREADNGKSRAESLEEADYLFNVMAAKGIKAAYQKMASTNLLSTINGFHPFYNKRSFLSWISSEASPYMKGSAIFSTIDSGTSVSQDLGYSYGSYEIDALMKEKGYFVRIWRRNPQGYWYLAAEILSDNVKNRS